MEPVNPTPLKIFRHDPLDLSKSSLRFVRLEPRLSAGGLIQCTIAHTTVEASYVCLSYRWGPLSPSTDILINGKIFSVRENLWDFLSMARENDQLQSQPFWIDALCIDQANTTEKNHQVAQMGQVFSGATCVHVWLGANKDLVTSLRILQDPEKAFPADWAVIRANRTSLEPFICHNNYWQRAWVRSLRTIRI
jgi:hypothetical protein